MNADRIAIPDAIRNPFESFAAKDAEQEQNGLVIHVRAENAEGADILIIPDLASAPATLSRGIPCSFIPPPQP